MAESKKFVERLETRIAALKAQLSRLESAKPVDELTVEDVYQVNPEFRERVHAAIRHDEWNSGAGTEKTVKTEGKESKDALEQLSYL